MMPVTVTLSPDQGLRGMSPSLSNQVLNLINPNQFSSTH